MDGGGVGVGGAAGRLRMEEASACLGQDVLRVWDGAVGRL